MSCFADDTSPYLKDSKGAIRKLLTNKHFQQRSSLQNIHRKISILLSTNAKNIEKVISENVTHDSLQ